MVVLNVLFEKRLLSNRRVILQSNFIGYIVDQLVYFIAVIGTLVYNPPQSLYRVLLQCELIDFLLDSC